MKKWILKAIVQKTISYLPFSSSINYVFQKYVTKGVYLTDEYFYDRLGHAKEHIEAFSSHSSKKTPETCLELGTGWYPVVPIAFFLIGVEKIYSVDISFLTSKERIYTTISKFLEAEERKVLTDYVKYQPQKFQILKEIYEHYAQYTLEEILEKLNIVYLIEDARKLSLPDNSVDLINSNNTFEHIYPDILAPIIQDFKRVVKKKTGVMSHFIDMSDHFAHFDKSINIYNFLQFSKAQWSIIDNSIQPQSRLRLSDYKKMYADLGIPILEEKNRPGEIEWVKAMQLHDDYKNYSLEDIAITHTQLVSVLS
jgi:Methyltransferase domain